MSTTLKAIRREMLNLLEELGEQQTISSLTTTTVVSAALAFGKWGPGAFTDRWIVRADATTSADLERLCTNFASSTGTLTHAGTNYSDTTATSEVVEINLYRLRLMNNAIQQALKQTRFLDRTPFPTVQNQTRYYLGDLAAWVEDAGDIAGVVQREDPNLLRNRGFDKWNEVNTSGSRLPDWWTAFGSGATVAQSTTQTWKGMPFSLAITRSGTDCGVRQTPGLLETGVTADTLRGETLTFGGPVWASVASRGYWRAYDGTQTVTTSAHTGGSTWEELTTQITVSSSATTLYFEPVVLTGDTTCYFGEGWAFEGSAMTDAIRRNAYDDTESVLKPGEYEFRKAGGVSPYLVLPATSRGRQYVVETWRPYPQFDSTRVLSGACDIGADASDAPVRVVATGAIAELYAGLAAAKDEQTNKYAELATYWRERFEELRKMHMERPTNGRGQRFGLDLTPRLLAPAPRW